ncbi:MAG: ribosome maturation factor RimP [Armatimonadetes bacterium]|nr:ribosome maturation factor RimP [Armatimonadota bacterium]
MSGLPQQIEEMIRQETEQRGMVLLEVIRRGQRNTSVVEVIVDSEQGVQLDQLTELSRWVSALLDQHEEAIAGRYRLEVSSAGLDRPLQLDWQYRKNVGRLLKLQYADSEGATRTEIFRLAEASADALTVTRRAGRRDTAEQLTIPLTDVKQAIVEPEL